MSSYRRGDVLSVAMPHAVGNEIKKDRPWVVLSPDGMNDAEFTLIVAPLTRGNYSYQARIPCTLAGVTNYIVLDQVRSVHYRRVRRRLGAISPAALKAALAGLREMFAE